MLISLYMCTMHLLVCVFQASAATVCVRRSPVLMEESALPTVQTASSACVLWDIRASSVRKVSHMHARALTRAHAHTRTHTHARARTHTHTRTHAHTHTHRFPFFVGTLHRRNGFYTVQTVFSIVLESNPTPKPTLTGNLCYFRFSIHSILWDL